MFLSKWSRGMAEETTRSVIILVLCARNSLVGLGTLSGVSNIKSRAIHIRFHISRDILYFTMVNSINSSVTLQRMDVINPNT